MADLKTLIDTSVSATKPNFADIAADRLAAFLAAQPEARGKAEIIEMHGGGEKAGASSGIVLFTARMAGEVGRYVLRYAPLNVEGRIFADYAMDGQFVLQRKLHDAGLATARPRWLDADGAQIGLPGFVMDHVEGVVADGSPYTGGLFAEATAAKRTALLDEVFKAQSAIHAVDWRGLDLAPHVRHGEGRTPIERYVNWFWRTIEWISPPQVSRLDAVRKRLFANQPIYRDDEYTLVHGDTGLGNYMFNEGRVIAILDWELAGIVHPTYDVAMSLNLNAFFRAAATPEIAARIPGDEAWIAAYERTSGRRVVDLDYFSALVALPSLIVAASMNRNLPEAMRAAHMELFEPLWAVAESV